MKVLCRSLLIGVSGSISITSMPGNIAFLRHGLVESVRVIMTAAATRMLAPETMQAYTGHPVFVDNFGGAAGLFVPHIQLTRDADVFLIMPATANVIAKAAIGMADDLLSATILASTAPVVIVPCMNEQMWNNPATRRNVGLARENGYHVMEPAAGYEVADMQSNAGVMPPLQHVIGFVSSVLKRGVKNE